MKKYTEYTIECGDITDTITNISQDALVNHDTIPYEFSASTLWIFKNGVGLNSNFEAIFNPCLRPDATGKPVLESSRVNDDEIYAKCSRGNGSGWGVSMISLCRKDRQPINMTKYTNLYIEATLLNTNSTAYLYQNLSNELSEIAPEASYYAAPHNQSITINVTLTADYVYINTSAWVGINGACEHKITNVWLES